MKLEKNDYLVPDIRERFDHYIELIKQDKLKTEEVQSLKPYNFYLHPTNIEYKGNFNIGYVVGEKEIFYYTYINNIHILDRRNNFLIHGLDERLFSYCKKYLILS